jgi:hypothetical protein
MEIDLDESGPAQTVQDDREEEGDPEDFLDVLDVFDGKDKAENGIDEPPKDLKNNRNRNVRLSTFF